MAYGVADTNHDGTIDEAEKRAYRRSQNRNETTGATNDQRGYFEKKWDAAKTWWNGGGPQEMPQNPYMGQWNSLIAQLQKQADGRGPSLAGNAYKQAQQTGMQNVLAQSRGGSAGAARMGMRNLGTMNQGMAQGYANARLQEQLAARQALTGALSGAGNAWLGPNAMNHQASQNDKTNGQQATAYAAQLASVIAAIYTGGGSAAVQAGHSARTQQEQNQQRRSDLYRYGE